MPPWLRKKTSGQRQPDQMGLRVAPWGWGERQVEPEEDRVIGGLTHGRTMEIGRAELQTVYFVLFCFSAVPVWQSQL